MKTITEFTKTVVAVLMVAIAKMDPLPEVYQAHPGETKIINSAKMTHKRPNGNQDNRKIVFTSGLMEPEGISEADWEKLKREIVNGTYRNQAFTSEFPVNLETQFEENEGTCEEQLAAMLLDQLIDAFYRMADNPIARLN